MRKPLAPLDRIEMMLTGESINNLKKYSLTITGLLIGAGGLNELTATGIIAWLILNFRECWSKTKLRYYWQDIVIVAVSILWIGQSSYNDPILTSDDNGLTVNEGVKILLWLLFALSMVRARKDVFNRTLNGIAYALGLFALATTIGALATQPFEGSRGLIFNVLTGDISAGSTYIAYSCITSTLLLVITQNKLAWLGSLTCIALGIQAVNRHSLIAGAATTIFLAIDYCRGLFSSRSKLAIRWNLFIMIAASISIVSILYIHNPNSNWLPIASISRLSEFSQNDARFSIYSVGYTLLGKSIVSSNFESLTNVNQYFSLIQPSWWHSLPLDSAQSNGWLGLALSIVWICGIGKGIINASTTKSKYVYVGVMTLVILFTSIPLGVGGYELLGSLTLTQAIISSDKT